PGAAVAPTAHHWKPRTDRRVKLEAVEAEGPIAEGGDHRALRVVELGGKGQRDGAPDRAGEAVDHPCSRLATSLDPLPELTAVGHEDDPAVEQRLERGAHAERMHGRPRAAAERVPFYRHGGARV